MLRLGTRLRSSIAAREASMLVALLLAAGAVWLFVEVAGEVAEGETRAVDEQLLLLLRTRANPSDPVGPAWVEELARDVTALGSAGILTLITFAAAGFLVLQRKRPLALYLVAAIAGGTVLSSLLKWGFARPRPELVAHGQVVYTSSFPSGHSMISAVAYLTLGALLASGQKNRGMHAYLMGLAVFLTLIVGISRVYLGVHWPTDVLAGWTAGAAWALLCWVVAKRLHVGGTVE
ncbi:MAG TPA: phosphatase PAP2 family protein [Gammaproteobacteria bacterium]|nr:phosphatase PAP2 family protein [Gammaproteobacteria bacterium]